MLILIKLFHTSGVESKFAPIESKYPIVSVDKLAKISRGASPRPIEKFLTEDVNGINWIKIGDVAVGEKYITHTAEKITNEGAKKSRRVKPGDFIVSNSMSVGRPYILKIDGCIHDGWIIIIRDFFEMLILNIFIMCYHLKLRKNNFLIVRVAV
ncbi:MAG: hypothetical protein ACLR6I_11910 [Waltera sp.]